MADKKSWIANIAVFASILLIVLGSRLIPHPPNFSALLSAGLFAGAKSANRWLAYLVPLIALWLSDLLLGIHYLMPLVAACVLLTVLLGQLTEKSLEDRGKWFKVLVWGGAGFTSSVIFFLVTNFAVWKTSGIYPLTQQGLWDCFFVAVPYFGNQILGTWLFTVVFFGGYHYLSASRIAERV